MPMYAGCPSAAYQSVQGDRQDREPRHLAKLAGTELTPETLYAAGLGASGKGPSSCWGSVEADRAYAVRGLTLSAQAGPGRGGRRAVRRR